MITDYKLVNTERKTGGNFTFFRNILLFDDDKEYQVIEDVTYEGNKEPATQSPADTEGIE